jgi:integrase
MSARQVLARQAAAMTEPAIRQRRQRRKILTDRMVSELKRRPRPYFAADPELPKFGIRVRPTGASYTVIVRDPYRKQRWVSIGNTAEMPIAEAREKAREVIKRVEAGESPFPPVPPKPESVESITALWLERHVRKNGLRTADEMERVIRKNILPYWGARDFASIRRRDIAALLDIVEREHGARMADRTLTILSSAAGWYVAEGRAGDDYVSPFREIRKRVPKGQGKRARILDDDELRRVWDSAGDAGAYGAFLRLALLTAQRYAKVAGMRWQDIDFEAGIWSIPIAVGEKGNAGRLALPDVALEIVRAMPKFAGNDRVFARNASGSFSQKRKRAIDAASGVHEWRVHDLRRTARSLMARAQVLSEIAERVMGHAVAGIEAVYDRHTYDSEKADAVRKLAALIETIVNPPTGNVVPIRETAAVS